MVGVKGLAQGHLSGGNEEGISATITLIHQAIIHQAIALDDSSTCGNTAVRPSTDDSNIDADIL